nr:MAG TPA: hypothetical protein [Caudoviricetes sp.]
MSNRHSQNFYACSFLTVSDQSNYNFVVWKANYSNH